jgi:outer membrane receptor protein involved in Fe transport
MSGRSGRRSACALLAVLGMAFPVGASAQTGVDVQARVEDALTGQPLRAVLVRAGATAGETGRDGGFALRGVADTATVVVERVGYVAARFAASDVPPVIRLAASPVLINALSATAEAGPLVARGTALSVASVQAASLQGTGGTTVAEALAGTEGVSVARVGGWGARPVLRGLTGERVAVLVDGNRVTRACAFGMDQGLATVDPGTVERVEILTGPGSALYGSGNIGGVINVVTRRPAGPGPVSGTVRSKVTTAAPGGSVGGTIRVAGDALAVSASLDATRSDDYRSPAGVVAGSGFRQATGGVGADLTLSPRQRMSFQGSAYEGRDIGWPAMPGGSIPLQSRRSAALDYAHQVAGALVDGVSARTYIQRLDHEMHVPMAMGSGDMATTQTTTQESHTTTTGARVQLRLLPMTQASAHVDVGLEATHRAAEATRWTTREGAGMPSTTLELHTWPAVRILDVGAFGQGEARISPRWTVVAGARADRLSRSAAGWPSTTDGVLTGNLGARAVLGRGLTARVSLGAGYRTPDPTELFGLALRPDGFIYVGNPELGTERSRNLELGLALDAARVSASVTAFHNEMNGLISPVPVPGETVEGRPVRSWENRAEARLSGASGTVRVATTPWLIARGTASWTRGEDRTTGLALPAVPPLEGQLGLRLVAPRQDGKRWIEAAVSGAARQGRVAEEVREAETPGWAVLDLRAGFELGATSLQLGVENALDHAYRGHLDPQRLLRPGRGLYLSATVPLAGHR